MILMSIKKYKKDIIEEKSTTPNSGQQVNE